MAIDFARGARVSDHAHGWGQLVYASRGVGRVSTDAAQWILPGGRAMWVPPGVPHVLHCVTRLELRSLYFPPDDLPRLPVGCAVVRVTPLLRELIRRVAENAPASSPRADRLVAVLREELEEAAQTAPLLPLPAKGPARRLADAFLADPGTPLSVVQLCDAAGGSRRTIERAFVQQAGTSLGAWLRVARLQHAALLLAGDRSVGSVAEEVGYRSASAFVAAFRRAFGETPARFRERRPDGDAVVAP